MAQLIIEVSDDRLARIQNLLRLRDQTPEQFVEPWLADADIHMGHNPMDPIEDQQAAAARFARKADAAVTARENDKAAQKAAAAASVEAAKAPEPPAVEPVSTKTSKAKA